MNLWISSDEESGNIADDLGIDTDIRFKGIEDPNEAKIRYSVQQIRH
ncbi:MAG: hypothetical protein CM15mP126_2450 [Gammaproteobacteria bacterium]|nr:MAG: hypothetical protein CM15mP126_2450 [Gammaproteobacteria bacterium]